MEQVDYVELHAHSAFTFLEGADSPAALVKQAAALELSGLAVLDVDGMYSAVQTAQAGADAGLPIVHGAELSLDATSFPDGSFPGNAGHGANLGSPAGVASRNQASFNQEGKGQLRLPILATSQQGYHALSGTLSDHFLKRKGQREANFGLPELAEAADGADWMVLSGSGEGPVRQALAHGGLRAARRVIDQLRATFGSDRVAVETTLLPHDGKQLADALAELAAETKLPLVATGNVHLATPAGQPLADVLTATRLRASLDEVEPHLPAWRSFLRSGHEMLQLHRHYPHAVAAAAELGKAFAFDLNLVDPGLPHFPVPEGHTEATWLTRLTYEGASRHYGAREEYPQAWDQIDHELRVIEQLGFPGYFLIVKDIVDFCSNTGILCQGRGSAANSAVCYALGITAVDAVRHKMLFERFLSPDRAEAPDIDLDIEAQEREQVIQYVYSRYGRKNAAMVANTITYRPKSAIRDAARAFGYPESQVKQWSALTSRSRKGTGSWGAGIPDGVLNLAAQMQRLPRHMGIHPGGMVLTRQPVSRVCPVVWAAMENRSVLQWDKEDCADAKLVKFDLLGLGMLTALRKAFTWLEQGGITWRGRPLDLHNLPQEDPRVYDLLCAADTVGVFQVESRAQMNTLPRLKPRRFYDIVVEVALIRPGPIQGQAVNPYLRRRAGREAVTYLHPLAKDALEKTLGVPLFQEQLMQLAVDVAGFTPGQADKLRRAIGAKNSAERMRELRPALFTGMTQRNIPTQVQEELFQQLQGFAEFGFPESHAFSFAYLVYASAWLKVHYPEHFYASILASQPMGFYSPATLVEDARRHGIKVLPPSVVHSDEQAEVVEVTGGTHTDDTGQEPSTAGVASLVTANSRLAVRLGLSGIKGIGQAASRIVNARGHGAFRGFSDLAARAELTAAQLEKLAMSGALADLGVSRREGVWQAAMAGQPSWHQPYLPGLEVTPPPSGLPAMGAGEEMLSDYQTLGLSTAGHPLQFLRNDLADRGVVPLGELGQVENGRVARIAGVVTHRQRPATAKGTTFLSLEDESGLANVICSVGVWKRYLKVAEESGALLVRGKVEKGEGAIAVVAQELQPLRLPVPVTSRDFR